MTHHVGPPPPAADYFGYSCQVRFALEIAGEIFGAESRRVWFSAKFNPDDNADSSNPCLLYIELSRTVQQNDVGSKRIEGHRTSLINMVDSEERMGRLSSQRTTAYRSRIDMAPIESFRPEIWRLDLRAISRRWYGVEDVDRLKIELRIRAQQVVMPPQVLQPDEYLIDDLLNTEYKVIILG